MINVHRKIWNNETKQHILDFCATYSKHQYVYFPADIHHDTVFFEELQQEISDLVMYDWTCQSLSTTLSIFQEATA